MNFIHLIHLLFLLSSPLLISGEFFSAITELENILQVESELATDLRTYITREEQRLQNLKKIADDFAEHSSDALHDPEVYLGNPINAFLLVKRFTKDWDQLLEKEIKPTHLAEFLESVNKKTLRFPTNEDLQGAGKALMRLQDTYDIPSHHFSTGHLLPDKSNNHVKLNTEECFRLGSIAYTSQDFYHTILWMNEALRLQEIKSHPSNHDIHKTLILDYLAFSYYKQGNVRKALNLTIDLLALEPDHIRAKSNYQFFSNLISEEESIMASNTNSTHTSPTPQIPSDSNPRPLDAYKSSLDFRNYESLCRKEETHKNRNNYKLRCFYMRHHPFLYFNPIKSEEVNWSPRMYLFHDVMTEDQINTVKRVAKTKLDRSVVYHKTDSASTTVQDYRVSKSAWLKDTDSEAVRQFSHMAGILANLTLDTVEDMQVLNYGIGGHYEPHYDFSTVDGEAFDLKVGNRVATFICYLSDVEAGGATVFPGIGVSYWPSKGKCAFWYNLDRNGTGDLRTRHAACPVLSGIKWVCNKWFHERGQEFIRPCLRE